MQCFQRDLIGGFQGDDPIEAPPSRGQFAQFILGLPEAQQKVHTVRVAFQQGEVVLGSAGIPFGGKVEVAEHLPRGGAVGAQA